MTTQLAARPFGPEHPDPSGRTAAPVIAFLGTGRMGGPMAANLARAGFGVRAWDRTASHAVTLAEDGATVAASPAEAVKGAGILITMLADGPATEQAWTGPDGLLMAASPGPIWIQMATVGLDRTFRQHRPPVRGELRRRPGLRQPGTGPGRGADHPGQRPPWLREAVDPVFAALGRATAWLGPAGHGTRAKLVFNNWLADLTETTAETLAFARGLSLDPPQSWTCWPRPRSDRPTRRKRPAPCWPATTPPRSRSSTRSKTPTSRPKPHRKLAPSSPSPTRCCRGGGAPRPAGTPTTTWPPSTPH